MRQTKLSAFLKGGAGAGTAGTAGPVTRQRAAAAAPPAAPAEPPVPHSIPHPWQELSIRNRHPRDDRLHFDEPTHIYTINGSSKGVISCTGFIHQFFGHFDADAVINGMIRRGLKPPYVGMTKAQIKKMWNDNGTAASEAGTAMHLAIEQFLHGHPELIVPAVKASPEWRYFNNFWNDVCTDLVPYRSEWEVWSEEYKLAGSIDMVFYRRSDDSYVIYDWKRCKAVEPEAFGGKTGLGPTSHLPDSKYWIYTIQLNVYRWFLETYYGLKISDLYLVILHPDNKNYVRKRLNLLPDVVEEMLACRAEALRQGSRLPVILPAGGGHSEEEENGHPAGAAAAGGGGAMFLDD